MVYLYGLKNNVIRCYFEIHMLSVVNYHGPGLIEVILTIVVPPVFVSTAPII